MYLDTMRITIYSECEYFKSGLQYLIDEYDLLHCSGDIQLSIVYVKKIYDGMSLLKFLANNADDFLFNNARIIVVSPGGYMHASEWLGITIVNSSMSLHEWRHFIKNFPGGFYPKGVMPSRIVEVFFSQQTNNSEIQLLNYIKSNMSPSEIAKLQQVSVKTAYSRIAAIKNKYRLSSTKELYLNADYIHKNIKQFQADNL